MRRLLQRWLMFVIVLALPLQGLAAAAMFHCAPAEAAAHAGDASLDGPVAPHHQHGDAGHVPHSHAAPAASDDADPADLQPPTKCSACASCCPAGALPSAPVVLASLELAQSFAPPAGAHVEPFVTHGPERPPRSFLA